MNINYDVWVSSSSLAEAHRLSGLLLRVAERVHADFGQLAAECDLTPVQARAVLWLETPSTMKALAAHLACDASNVTGIADRLNDAGLAERVDGSDRRVKILQLTPRGKRLRVELARRVAEGSTVNARLGTSERRQLATLLDKLLG